MGILVDSDAEFKHVIVVKVSVPVALALASLLAVFGSALRVPFLWCLLLCVELQGSATIASRLGRGSVGNVRVLRVAFYSKTNVVLVHDYAMTTRCNKIVASVCLFLTVLPHQSLLFIGY